MSGFVPGTVIEWDTRGGQTVMQVVAPQCANAGDVGYAHWCSCGKDRRKK